MMGAPETVDRLMDATERLGVVGSPSSTTELAVDVLGAAVTGKLVGELALFRYAQDGATHYALGQITEVKLRNIWHEDPTMRSLIRQRGRVDAVSERQDTHLAQMVISAVFKAASHGLYEPSLLGTVPSTGTVIHVVTDDILEALLRPYRDQVYYLGHVYGSRPRLPLWFKHFASGRDGAGEAYHIGIFGKTGSGKSVLAKMVLLAYARHKEMGLLIVDPQGEFARDFRGEDTTGEFKLPMKKLAEDLGKSAAVLEVRNLVLDRWDLFQEILAESDFFFPLTVPRGTNREEAVLALAEKLQKGQITLASLHERQSFDQACTFLGDDSVQKQFYKTAEPRARFAKALADVDRDDLYSRHWLPVARLFTEEQRPKARTVEKALNWVLAGDDGKRNLLVIDLSRERAEGMFWNDRIQSLVIGRVIDGITFTAERLYASGRTLNTLVMIDEAHRLAPREAPSENPAAKRVRSVLVDASRTTRKYGLGWLFISQSLSSLHADILGQMRILFFGFGLGLGQEFEALKQLVGTSGSGGAALDLYRLFRDPHSAFDTQSRIYSFMTIGPVSPLSFSGTPLFLNAFNTPEAFARANALTLK